MTTEPGREIHVSPNGDRWRLLCNPGTGYSFVRHKGNAASGGHVTEIGLSAFLAADRGGPEHRALWLLIASLSDERSAPVTTAA